MLFFIKVWAYIILLLKKNGIIESSVTLTKTLPLSFLSFNTIYSNITKLTSLIDNAIGYYFLNFSISNDNQTFSFPPVTLIAYNSTSYTCSSTTLTCTSITPVKKSFCFYGSLN